MSRQTFELNGRHYDTLTGAIMPQAFTPQQQPASTPLTTRIQPKPAARPQTVSIDGMLLGDSPISKPLSARASAPRATSPLRHVSAHQPQPTKTLMRHAVKAPSLAAPMAPAQPATQAAPLTARPVRGMAPSVIPKLSSSRIDPRRAMSAQNASRSQALQRFGATSPSQTWTGTAATATSVSGINLAPRTGATPAPQQVRDNRTPIARTHNTFAAPTRRPTAQGNTPVAQTPIAKPASEEDDQDIFTRALAEASSHEQTLTTSGKRKKGKHTKRILSVAASAAVFLGLIGFIGFQNRDDIRLQLASAKAGFPASAPLYKPDGYALASMKYATGSVASIYQHKDQGFTITQKKSNWDSQTLLENFVANNNGDYKGFQSNGRTIYVYGKGNATWVNGGIWYQIKATGNLTNEQLVRIAASM